MINSIISKIRHYRYKRYMNALLKNGLKVGKNTDIHDGVFLDPSHCFLISIGDNCILAPNVRLIAHDASTRNMLGYSKMGRIEINDNCFIGDSSIILPNVSIGPNSIIGAGSVVTKNIAANTVAAGNPAKPICRTEEYLEIIKDLSKDKKIFGEDYYIDKLNESMRQEIVKSLKDGIGFIV